MKMKNRMGLLAAAAISLLGVGQAASADTIVLVDLGVKTGVNDLDANDLDAVNTWNISDFSTSGAALVDSTGAATNFTLTYSTNVTWNHNETGSTTWFASDFLLDGTTPNPDKDPVLALGMGDSVGFARLSTESGTYTTAFLTFTGLDVNATYSLDMIGLNPGSGNLTLNLQVSDNGVLRWGDSGENRRGGAGYQTKTSGFQPNNHEVMKWTGVTPDANGEILISYSASNNYAGTGRLGAIRLTEIIPEPASMSLLAIGGMGLLLKRRGRRRMAE